MKRSDRFPCRVRTALILVLVEAAKEITRRLNPRPTRLVAGVLMLGMLLLAACSHPASPSSVTSLAPTTTPSEADSTPTTSVAALERATATPVPTTTPSSTPTPTRRPKATAPRPKGQLLPPYEQALKPAFQSDENRLPNATRYRVDLRFDADRATLDGHQHICYTNTESIPLDDLYLRLFPNTTGYSGDMTVSNVALSGKRVEPTRELQGSSLRIPLDPALAPGKCVTVTLDFMVALPSDSRAANDQEVSNGYRQLGFYEGVAALANAYPIIPVHDDEGWNVELAPSYGDAVFSDAAFFDATITASQTMTLAASGTCTTTETDAGETTWSCVAAPMRDFIAILGKDYRVESRDVQGGTVNSVFYAGHQEGGAAALDYASRAMRLFDGRIAAYPFAELDVVETPTLAGGIEYPGLVVINQTYYDSAQGVSERMEWVVVHEVLHQWWYSLVGSDQVDEPWLDEALVQYCTLLYYEEQYGKDVAARLVESVFQQTYQQLQENGRDQPVGLPVEAYSRRDYGPVVYQKGPLYFHQLRQRVGLETFWDILEVYYERNRYGIARPEDWLTAVETVTGSDYRSIYDEWIQE